MNRWRLPTWLLLIWTGICIAWVAAGPASLPFRDGPTPMAASVAVGLVFFLWMVGMIVLGVVWLRTVTRSPPPAMDPLPWGPNSQPGERMACGRCDKPLSPVWRGKCQHCGAPFAEYDPIPRDPKV